MSHLSELYVLLVPELGLTYVLKSWAIHVAWNVAPQAGCVKN